MTTDRSYPSRRAASGLDLALVVIGASFLGGLTESGVIFAARALAGRYTLLNPQAVWLAPLANLVLFALPIASAWYLGHRRSRDRAMRWSLAVALTLAMLEVYTIGRDRVHPAAAILLCIGIASRVAWWIAWSPERFRRVIGVSTALMVSLSAGLTAWFNGSRAKRESEALASVSRSSRPNVILLVLDTVRAASLSAYGYSRQTSPFLAELATRGVLFERALSPAPWTLPSHASLFTGRDPHEMSASWSTPLDRLHPTLAEVLSNNGYATVGVAANLRYVSYEFGLARGFGYYRDYDVSVSEAIRASGAAREFVHFITEKVGVTASPGRQSAARIFERFFDWERTRGGRPFFAFMNVYDAHAPYAPPPPYDTLFLGRQSRVRVPEIEQGADTLLADLEAAYDASIAYLDAQLHDFFAELERRELLENTLVVVTSDHGEEFNEHGYLNHGNSLYLRSVHVPLLLSFPGRIPPGQTVPDIVSLRDVGATILGQLGVGEPSFPGVALLDARGEWGKRASPAVNELDFARNLPAALPVSKGDLKAVHSRGLRYILNGDGRGELYDVFRDPLEREDISGEPSYRAARDSLRENAIAIPGRKKVSR